MCYNKAHRNHASNDRQSIRAFLMEEVTYGLCTILAISYREEPRCQQMGNGSERAFSGS